MNNISVKEIISKYRSIIGLIMFSLIIALLNERFLTFSNISNVLRYTDWI